MPPTEQVRSGHSMKMLEKGPLPHRFHAVDQETWVRIMVLALQGQLQKPPVERSAYMFAAAVPLLGHNLGQDIDATFISAAREASAQPGFFGAVDAVDSHVLSMYVSLATTCATSAGTAASWQSIKAAWLHVARQAAASLRTGSLPSDSYMTGTAFAATAVLEWLADPWQQAALRRSSDVMRTTLELAQAVHDQLAAAAAASEATQAVPAGGAADGEDAFSPGSIDLFYSDCPDIVTHAQRLGWMLRQCLAALAAMAGAPIVRSSCSSNDLTLHLAQ